MGSKITSPRTRSDYSVRQTDCQNAMEKSLTKLMSEARIAGWLEGETAVALVQLAQSHLTWLLAGNDTEAALSAKNALRQVRMKKTTPGDARLKS